MHLAADAELLDEAQVCAAVVFGDECQQAAAATNQLQQTAAGSKVLAVHLQVLSQFFDALGGYGNLGSSTTGIGLVRLHAGDGGLFFLTCNHTRVFYQMGYQITSSSA